MQSSAKEKGRHYVTRSLGLGDKLYEMEKEEKEIYNRRLTIRADCRSKEKVCQRNNNFISRMHPKEPISASSLIKQQQGDPWQRMARTSESGIMLNCSKSSGTSFNKKKINDITNKITSLRTRAGEDSRKEAQVSLSGLMGSTEVGTKTIAELQDESTKN